MGQKHKRFREFRTPFPLRDIRENPRSNVRACSAADGAIGHVRYINILTWLRGFFGVVFFVSKSLLGIKRQKKLEKFAILTRKPRSHARILIYRTWPICSKNRKIVPYHGANPNTRNGARLRSPSLIMAPAQI